MDNYSNINSMYDLINAYSNQKSELDDAQKNKISGSFKNYIGISKEKAAAIVQTFLENIETDLQKDRYLTNEQLSILDKLHKAPGLIKILKPVGIAGKIKSTFLNVFKQDPVTNLDKDFNKSFHESQTLVIAQLYRIIPSDINNRNEIAQNLYYELCDYLEEWLALTIKGKYEFRKIDFGEFAFKLACQEQKNGKCKAIISTHKLIGEGNFNRVKETLELELIKKDKGKRSLKIGTGVKRKATILKDLEQCVALQEQIQRKRDFLTNIPWVNPPSSILFKPKSFEFEGEQIVLYQTVSYEAYLGNSLSQEVNSPGYIMNAKDTQFLTRTIATSLLAMRPTDNKDDLVILGDIKPDNILIEYDKEKQISKATLIDTDGAEKGVTPRVASLGYLSFMDRTSLKKGKDMIDVNQDIFSFATMMLKLTDREMKDQLSHKIMNLHQSNMTIQEKKEALKSYLKSTEKNSIYFKYLLEAINLDPKDIAGGRKLLKDMLEGRSP
ncbi:MAG: hypothetical protein K0S74_1470 [Chlamydiales bacterium]|jgi:hypothetical protein|nr:hypothetical protein [Chlamydiales bacterium]